MAEIIVKVGHALLMAFGMLWQTGWSLARGFTIGVFPADLFCLNHKNPMSHDLAAHHARDEAGAGHDHAAHRVA